MKEKKSYKADLEGKRITGFLLGLVVVLAVFIVLLEFNTQSADTQTDSNLLDDLSQDIEMIPMLQRDMIPAETSAPSTQIDKLNIVDSDVSEAEDNTAIDDKLTVTADDASGMLVDNGEDITTETTVAANDKPLDFRVVEKLPEFPGGMKEFMKWLTKNLRYPITAQQQFIEGKVLVSFIVNKDGTVVAQKVVKSADPLLDKEALRVIRNMPKWKAGIDNGQPCRTYMCIPVVFKL
ncbi:MAG: energy transducer TonB [Prevotella sp.]|nr:energy transducer TonB [Prevotella sp.]